MAFYNEGILGVLLGAFLGGLLCLLIFKRQAIKTWTGRKLRNIIMRLFTWSIGARETNSPMGALFQRVQDPAVQEGIRGLLGFVAEAVQTPKKEVMERGPRLSYQEVNPEEDDPLALVSTEVTKVVNAVVHHYEDKNLEASDLFTGIVKHILLRCDEGARRKLSEFAPIYAVISRVACQCEKSETKKCTACTFAYMWIDTCTADPRAFAIGRARNREGASTPLASGEELFHQAGGEIRRLVNHHPCRCGNKGNCVRCIAAHTLPIAEILEAVPAGTAVENVTARILSLLPSILAQQLFRVPAEPAFRD